MISTVHFNRISLAALAHISARTAQEILGAPVHVVEIGDPAHYWGGSAQPERGYTLLSQGRAVADVVEEDGRHWIDWLLAYDAAGSLAFDRDVAFKAEELASRLDSLRSTTVLAHS